MAPLPGPAEIARRLITFPTVNPPGDEAEAQGYLASILEDAEVAVERFSAVEGRPNLIARLQGSGDRPPLVLHGHVDVVGVDGQRWDHDPFEGHVADGVLHGRGALDMKSGLAMLTHAFVRTAHEGTTPSGDVVLVAAVDSETGGSAGLAYLLDGHPDVFEGARYAIGEFGGFPLFAFGRTFYRIGVSQKQYAHLRLRVLGRGGHGSRPAYDTVVGTLGRVLARLDGARLPHHSSRVVEAVIDSIADAVAEPTASHLRRLTDPATFEEALGALGALGETFEALFRDTANPTLVRAGAKFNVIPAEGTAEIDARILPGRSVDELVAEIERVVEEPVEIEVLAAGPPAPDDYDDGLFDTLAGILTDLDPGAVPIPYVFTESPDSRLFADHGIQHYGFLPMNLPRGLDLPALIHGPDERVPVEAIEFGAEAIHRLLTSY